MRHRFTFDWRDAWRSLRATPLVTTIAVLSLALGIGANTALFSILNSLILKSLPVRDPQQLVVLDGGDWTNPIWEQIRAHEREIADGAFAWSATHSTSRREDRPTSSTASGPAGGCSTCSACSTVLGRTLTPADDARGGGSDGAVAVISYSFWQRRYGGAADVIGRTISDPTDARSRLSASRSKAFSDPMSAARSTWRFLSEPSQSSAAERACSTAVDMVAEIMARLRPGQTIEQATRPAARYPAADPGWRRSPFTGRPQIRPTT